MAAVLEGECGEVEAGSGGEEVCGDFSVGGGVLEAVAGTAAEDEHVFVVGVAVDDEVMVRCKSVDAGLHFLRFDVDTFEVATDAGGKLGGVFGAGCGWRQIGIDDLAKMLVVSDLDAAVGRGHAVPASVGVEDEDRGVVDALMHARFVTVGGLEPGQDAAFDGQRYLQLGQEFWEPASCGDYEGVGDECFVSRLHADIF